MYFTDKKHETGGNPKDDSQSYPLQEWRMRDRLKTVSAVLALCLNIGVDPPDVIKTNPCARLECWVDPATPSGTGATNTPINQIGKALQTQYEQLSMRTRYKLSLDPTVDETRRYATTLRRNARNERVLFHYNGHGVPKPTSSGEIWVFNRTYTQYIPISLYDLQSWVGAPSLFVWDCSDSGLIIQNFLKFAEKHEAENNEVRRRDPEAETMDFTDCVHLAACRDKENLPTNPELPADIFTSCLTTPIEMAVRFFILQNPLPSAITAADAANIPGRVSERRTPIGELNWIFTAITDTIAWSSLPRPLFKKLFRQDLMVAALFRNFLLAQRIMRVYHCHPQCYPPIPQTHDHPLWRSWDLAVEMILSQLPDLLAAERGEKQFEYQHSNFFAEQLTAFEVYLTQGAIEQKMPEQLPVVLQVLLSQVHRLRALILLSKFLDLGPWAVNLALSIGIFPYVLKLLQSQAMELKPVMVFIWARILAVDHSCQGDLLKDNGYQYFTSIINPTAGMLTPTSAAEQLFGSMPPSRDNSHQTPYSYSPSLTDPFDVGVPVGNVSEHRAMCAFIIAMFCKDYHQGQNVCLSQELIESCLLHLDDLQNPLLRQWSCLCISMLWLNYSEAKWVGIRCSAHQKLCELVVDPVAEVRTAMLHALTTFLGIPDLTPQVAQIEESIASMVLVMASDGNAMVRKELLVFFSTFVHRYQNRFVATAYEQLLEEHSHLNKTPFDEAADRMTDLVMMKNKPRSAGASLNESGGVSSNSVFSSMWKQILIMSVDPHPEIAQNASTIVDVIFAALLQSQLAPFCHPMMDTILAQQGQTSSRSSFVEVSQGHATPLPSQPPTPPTPTRPEGYISASLKRTASVAASLKNLAFGTPTAAQENSPRSPGPGRMTLPPRGGDWNQPPDSQDQRRQGQGVQPFLRTPAPRHFESRDIKDTPMVLPLKSHFFSWCVEYFREPQMKPSEADEPGSKDYNERLWRRNRNDGIIDKTQPQKDHAGTHPWDRAKGFFNNGTQPVKMCFHQFEDHLIVSDDRDGVAVWDWKKQSRLSRFSNGNPARSKITEVRLINEDDQALLMTGSSDGVIKLFRNYESQKQVELVTAFRALTDLEPSTKNAGLVFDWQQSRGLVLVAGDVRNIRVWNAGTEICTADINARSGSPITSLTSDQVEGHFFIAGFGDGALRLYDQRQKAQTAMVQVWKEHKSWVTNVHLQRGGQRELVSACRNGEVKLWDMRWDRCLQTIRATRDTLRTLSVHEHAPVFAVGTDRHIVKIYSMMQPSSPTTVGGLNALTSANTTFNASSLALPAAGSHGFGHSTSRDKEGLLNIVEPYSGFLNPGRGSPISCTAFHPHRMMIAASAMGDTHVNIFACSNKGKEKALGER
jgi:regulator-associated protein of mTOR